MWKNWSLCALLVGIVKWHSCYESGMVFPSEIKCRIIIWCSSSPSCYMPQRTKSRISTDTAHLCWQQHHSQQSKVEAIQLSMTDAWTNKMWYILVHARPRTHTHTEEPHSALRRKFWYMKQHGWIFKDVTWYQVKGASHKRTNIVWSHLYKVYQRDRK